MQALKYVIQDLSQQLSECAQEGGEGEEQIKAAELNHQLNDYKQEVSTEFSGAVSLCSICTCIVACSETELQSNRGSRV